MTHRKEGGVSTALTNFSYYTSCVAYWGVCRTWDGRLQDFFGSLPACVAALASQGLMGSRGGQPATRAEACTWFLRAFFGVVQQETTIKDFSNVSDEAADFMIIWEIGDSAYDVEDLANLLESVLDIAIGGYDFGDIDDDSLDEQDEQRQFEVHQSLLNIWDLLSQRGLTQTSDTVYVTRRRVVRRFGIDSNWHAALEYVSASTLGLNPTIAAYNSGGFLVSGQLVSRLNQLSEHNNIVAGIVTSLIYPTGSSLWSALLWSERFYCQNLDYAHPLFEPHEPDEYNSNGFSAGIIDSVFGTTNAPIGTFYLGSHPVPVTEFQSRECEDL